MKDYNIIKTLGKGYSGISYLVEKNGKKYVIKRQKLLPKEVKYNTKYQFWREIDFNKFVNKLPKNQKLHFMEMFNYKINNCDYKHIPKYIPPTEKKELEKRNRTKICLDTALEYKGDVIEFKIKNGMPIKERYCLIIQLLYALQVIREHGYMHQDIHQGNITYNKSNFAIKIYGHTLPCKNIYSLIDYGLARHKKYNKTKKDKKDFKDLFESNNDIYEVMYQIILQQYMLYLAYIDNKWKFPIFNKEKTKERFIKFYNEKSIWNKIKDILIDDKDWFVYFDKYYVPKPNDISVAEKIEYLFSAFNRKKYLKIMGWTNIYIPNFLPSKDIIFMVQNIKDNKKIIKYLFNKL